MTKALVAAWFFAGNLQMARQYLLASGDIPEMVSKSRLSRRLHTLTSGPWKAILKLLTDQNERTFLLDSCPMPVCQFVRSRRCRLYRDRACCGYCAAKKMSFYGWKVHLIKTADGQPVEIELLAGCGSDIAALKEEMPLELPSGSCLYADKGYPVRLFLAQRGERRAGACHEMDAISAYSPGLPEAIGSKRSPVIVPT